MIKPGFSLAEFLIASLISGMLSVSLFAMLAQINRVVNRVDTMSEIYANASLMHNQFEWDISGVFVPQLGQIEDDTAQKKPAEDQKKAEEDNQKKSPSGKTDTQEKKEKKKLAKIFYGVGPDKNFELTFVTSNPLQVYWSADVGKAKPRVARVRYFIVEHRDKPGSFSLMRQESDDLDIAAWGRPAEDKVRAYTLADHIKEIKVEYVLRKEKEDKSTKEGKAAKDETVAAEKKAPEFEYVVVKEWNIEKDSDDETAKLMKKAVVPYSVRISWAVWDIRQEASEQFMCIVPIIADNAPMEKREKKSTAAPKPKQEQPQNVLTAQGSVEDRFGVTRWRNNRQSGNHTIVAHHGNPHMQLRR